jgi:hypothetical protein
VVGIARGKGKEYGVTIPDKKGLMDWKCGAYEPCSPVRHGDIEWLYTLDLTNQTILIESIWKGKTKMLTFNDLKKYSEDWEKLEKEFD